MSAARPPPRPPPVRRPSAARPSPARCPPIARPWPAQPDFAGLAASSQRAQPLRTRRRVCEVESAACPPPAPSKSGGFTVAGRATHLPARLPRLLRGGRTGRHRARAADSPWRDGRLTSQPRLVRAARACLPPARLPRPAAAPPAPARACLPPPAPARARPRPGPRAARRRRRPRRPAPPRPTSKAAAQPVLRRPAAIPLIVSRRARCRSGSPPPLRRWSRSSTCRWCSGSR